MGKVWAEESVEDQAIGQMERQRKLLGEPQTSLTLASAVIG